MRRFTSLCLLLLVPGFAACTAAPPVTIQHVVLLKLNNPDRQDALIDDCNRLLPGIDGVVSYWCGTPDQSGRVNPTIDMDWDVALCVGYTDAEAYAAYVTDPNHVALVTAWRPELQWLRIHDVSLHHNMHNRPTLRE
jgi:hypothetical protein